MILKCLLMFCFVGLVCGENVESDDYMDTLINLLMNGDAVDYEMDVHDDADPMLVGDLWKCGDCDGIDDSKLIYTEANNVDNTVEDLPIEIQIGVAAPNMLCVTVKTDLEGSIVRRIIGACSGGAVTLTVAPPQHFVVNAYS